MNFYYKPKPSIVLTVVAIFSFWIHLQDKIPPIVTAIDIFAWILAVGFALSWKEADEELERLRKEKSEPLARKAKLKR